MTIALHWAGKGFRAGPIGISWDEAKHATNKRPLTPNGHHDWSTDMQVVRDHFVHAEGKLRAGEVLGVGMRPDGHVVADADRHGKGDGVAYADSIGATATWTVDTASGGEHRYYLKPDPGLRYSNAVPAEWDGLVDIRADKGWVVAPGTVTPWGSWTEREPWDPATVAVLPPRVAEKLRPATSDSAGGAWSGYRPAEHDQHLHPKTVEAHQVLVDKQGVDPRYTTFRRQQGREPWLEVTRPGKSGGVSASLGYVGPGVLNVFSTGWEGVPQGAHDVLLAGWLAGLSVTATGAESAATNSEGQDSEGTPNPAEALRVIRADQVRATRVRYLWQDRIPLDAVTVAPGEEGIGKSTVLARLAADITSGTLPGDLHGKPAAVVVVAPEDQLAALAVPRLREAGADLTRVQFIAGRIGIDGTERGIEIPADLPVLGAYCQQIGARLVWIDSLVTTMPDRAKTVSYKDVASILRRVGDFAETHGVAVVAPWHLNKSAGTDTALRMMDSRAFRTAARSVLLFVGDPDAPGEGLIALDKANGTDLTAVPAIRYRLRSATFTVDEVDEDTGEVVTRIAGCAVADLVGEEAGFGRDAARDMLAPRLEREDDPKHWLRQLLADRGETTSSDVMAAGQEAGYSRTALYRAAQAVGVQYREDGVGGKPPTRRTWWSLPGHPSPSSQSSYSQTNGTNGTTGDGDPPDGPPPQPSRETRNDIFGPGEAQSSHSSRSSARRTTGTPGGTTGPACGCDVGAHGHGGNACQLCRTWHTNRDLPWPHPEAASA